jgi:hypothetical protein
MLAFKRVGVTTGWMRADVNALGLAVTLDPIEPTPSGRARSMSRRRTAA